MATERIAAAASSSHRSFVVCFVCFHYVFAPCVSRARVPCEPCTDVLAPRASNERKCSSSVRAMHAQRWPSKRANSCMCQRDDHHGCCVPRVDKAGDEVLHGDESESRSLFPRALLAFALAPDRVFTVRTPGVLAVLRLPGTAPPMVPTGMRPAIPAVGEGDVFAEEPSTAHSAREHTPSVSCHKTEHLG